MKTTLEGELRAALETVSDSVIPSGTSILDFTFAKDFPVQSGLTVRQLKDSNAFVTLDGVGAAATVTTAALLVLRASAPTILRLTQQNVGSAQVLYVDGGGVVILPFDSQHYLTLLEAQGTGKLEYFVAGPQ